MACIFRTVPPWRHPFLTFFRVRILRGVSRVRVRVVRFLTNLRAGVSDEKTVQVAPWEGV